MKTKWLWTGKKKSSAIIKSSNILYAKQRELMINWNLKGLNGNASIKRENIHFR
jgi:hypothetical protein